jgi:hypothetical protein
MLGMDNSNLHRQALAEMPKLPRFTPSSGITAARIVEVLAYPSVQLLDVTGPLQVFASANDLVAEAGGTPPYVLRVKTASVRCMNGSARISPATCHSRFWPGRPE